MTTYLVTTEIKTSWWLKVLRFFKIKSKLQTFELLLNNQCFFAKDIISTGSGVDLRVISREKE